MKAASKMSGICRHTLTPGRLLEIEQERARMTLAHMRAMRERIKNPQTLDDALLAVAVEQVAKRIAFERPRAYNRGP